MTNRWYAKGAEKQMQAQINLLTDTLKVAAVKNTYVENMDADEFFSDVSAHVVGTPQTLTGKSIAGGKLDANDPVFTAVAAGDTVECLVIYKDTGVAGTSPLLMRLDQVTSLPFATSGGDIDPKWDNGAYRIFSMVP
jgi:hypothetical protein